VTERVRESLGLHSVGLHNTQSVPSAFQPSRRRAAPASSDRKPRIVAPDGSDIRQTGKRFGTGVTGCLLCAGLRFDRDGGAAELPVRNTCGLSAWPTEDTALCGFADGLVGVAARLRLRGGRREGLRKITVGAPDRFG
jgi:hypothetical protein